MITVLTVTLLLALYAPWWALAGWLALAIYIESQC